MLFSDIVGIFVINKTTGFDLLSGMEGDKMRYIVAWVPGVPGVVVIAW